MDSQLDEFKSFVRKYPGLKNDVRSGKATWQSIYEEWYLYGEDDSQWEKYKEVTQESNQSAPATDKTKSETKSTTTSNSSSATLSGTEMMAQAFQYLQKMDMNKVQQTMTTVQKFYSTFPNDARW